MDYKKKYLKYKQKYLDLKNTMFGGMEPALVTPWYESNKLVTRLSANETSVEKGKEDQKKLLEMVTTHFPDALQIFEKYGFRRGAYTGPNPELMFVTEESNPYHLDFEENKRLKSMVFFTSVNIETDAKGTKEEAIMDLNSRNGCNIESVSFDMDYPRPSYYQNTWNNRNITSPNIAVLAKAYTIQPQGWGNIKAAKIWFLNLCGLAYDDPRQPDFQKMFPELSVHIEPLTQLYFSKVAQDRFSIFDVVDDLAYDLRDSEMLNVEGPTLVDKLELLITTQLADIVSKIPEGTDQRLLDFTKDLLAIFGNKDRITGCITYLINAYKNIYNSGITLVKEAITKKYLPNNIPIAIIWTGVGAFNFAPKFFAFSASGVQASFIENVQTPVFKSLGLTQDLNKEDNLFIKEIIKGHPNPTGGRLPDIQFIGKLPGTNILIFNNYFANMHPDTGWANYESDRFYNSSKYLEINTNPGALLKMEDRIIYVNAWDPHSRIGNGNMADGSLDGYIGARTGLNVLCHPNTNPNMNWVA